jgi:acyl-CoA dehydrogenase
MFAEPSARTQDLLNRMRDFFDAHIYPNEARHHEELHQRRRNDTQWEPLDLIEELKPKARAAGLWNMFLPQPYKGPGRHLQPGLRTAVRGDGPGVLVGRGVQLLGAGHRQHGDPGALRHRRPEGTWLEPLLDGEIRSAFLMTEPAVASSDATNIQCSITRDGDHYVINGRKWFSSGAGNPRCAIFIVMGKTDPDGPRHAASSRWCWCRATPRA